MRDTENQCILIVDDERLNRKILTGLLEEQYQVVIAKSGKQALDRLASDVEIDLILLDVMMPDMDGYEVLRRIKTLEKVRDIPVIFITALNSVDDEEKGLNLGAADYITKPFHPGIVRLRVRNHLRFQRYRKILENLAGHDGLTEIANRRRFDEVLEKEWQRNIRNGQPLSLVMIDVDFFKLFNDHYGHARGDQALKSVARVLTWCLKRPADLAARYGGEEFVLLLPDTDVGGAKVLAEKIRAGIEELSIPHSHSPVASCVTVSIGGCATSSNQACFPTAATLLEAADTMLYQAKNNGRNQVAWKE